MSVRLGGNKGNVIGQGATVVGHLAVFDNTTADLIIDGGPIPTPGDPEPAGDIYQVQFNGGGAPEVFAADPALNFIFTPGVKKFIVGDITENAAYTFIQPNAIESYQTRTSANEANWGFDLLVDATGTNVDARGARVYVEKVDAAGGTSSTTGVEIYAYDEFSESGVQSGTGVFIEVSQSQNEDERLDVLFGINTRVLNSKESNSGLNTNIVGHQIFLSVSNDEATAPPFRNVTGIRIYGSGNQFDANAGVGCSRLSGIVVDSATFGGGLVGSVAENYGVFVDNFGGGAGTLCAGVRVGDWGLNAVGNTTFGLLVDNQNGAASSNPPNDGVHYSIYTRAGRIHFGDTIEIPGATSGKALIVVEAVAGTPTLTFPTVTGTLALVSPATQNFRVSPAPGQSVIDYQAATPNATDTGAETVTFAVDPGYQTGTICTIKATIGGLTAGTVYYIRRAAGPVFSFHTTVADAFSGSNKVNLTANVTNAIIPSGVATQTIYAVPHAGSSWSMQKSGVWKTFTDTEKSLAVGTLTANKNYTIFVRDNAGTRELSFGSSWSADIEYGQLPPDCTLVDGVPLKTSDNDYRCIAVGRADTTTAMIVDFGGIVSQRGGKIYLSNWDNVVPVSLAQFDSTTSWTMSATTFRQANSAGGANGNRLDFISARPGVVFSATAHVYIGSITTNQGVTAVGFNSTTEAQTDAAGPFGSTVSLFGTATCPVRGVGPIGLTTLYPIEKCSAAVGNVTFYGGANREQSCSATISY